MWSYIYIFIYFFESTSTVDIYVIVFILSLFTGDIKIIFGQAYSHRSSITIFINMFILRNCLASSRSSFKIHSVQLFSALDVINVTIYLENIRCNINSPKTRVCAWHKILASESAANLTIGLVVLLGMTVFFGSSALILPTEIKQII